MPASMLLERIQDRSARVGVVGLGYVGLPLLLRFTEAGFAPVGFDIDPEKRRVLASGSSYFEHIPDARVQAALAAGLGFAEDLQAVGGLDVIILCLPTPLGVHREPDLSYIEATMAAMQPHLRQGQLLVLESTTYPGTTEEVLLPHLQRAGFEVGRDAFLVYSPEREDPGNSRFNTQSIPKIVSGYSERCAQLGLALYAAIVDQVVPVSNLKTAELTKLLENIYRAVNIGLVNEMKLVADRMGIDIFEVIEAAATKPFGFTPFYPGPGLGGHCIPIDPFYLTWKAHEYGLHTRFIELAGEVNGRMPEFVCEKVARGLNDRGRPLKGSRVLVLGVAYKKNVSDVRESPAFAIMAQLIAAGAEVAYSDPHVSSLPPMRRYAFELASQPLSEALLAAQDAVVVCTDHDAFDYPWIARHAQLIVDTRGVYRQPAGNVLRA